MRFIINTSFGKTLALVFLGATLVCCEEGGSIRAAARNAEDLPLPPSSEPMIDVTSTSEACEPNPCYNGGHCVPPVDEDQNNTSVIICLCSTGFYGSLCNETDDDLTLELEKQAEEAATELAFAISEENEGHNRTLYANDDDNGHRELQNIEDWVCVHPDDRSNLKGTVSIWWGFSKTDASWACNNWKSACKGSCTALPIKMSSFACYTHDPMIHAGTVEITWGHEAKDGTWACNNWRDPCKEGQNCFVRDVAYVIDSENNMRWNNPPVNTCTGNGGSCNAVYLDNTILHLKSFKNDKTWAKVEGCGGGFEVQAAEVSSEGSVTVSLGSAEVYRGWEGCCGMVGKTLQLRGLITDGWLCRKNADVAAVEINLIGKDACWKQNTRCLAGTTCNFCCNGSRWVWEWFGDHCN